MSSSAWDQFKKNWVSFVMTTLLGISSFTAYKVDKFVDRVNTLEKQSMLEAVTDSIQTMDIRELKISCGVMEQNYTQQEMRIQKLEAILPKNKNKPQ
jgi:hypothetical protein